MQKLEQENLPQNNRMSEEVDLETRQIYLIGGGDGNAEVRMNNIYFVINIHLTNVTKWHRYLLNV